MYIAIGIAAALFAADRILKYLSRTGKLKWERRYVRLTHLENRGFFLGLGQKHEKLLRWLPLGVWLAAAACLLPELGKRVFSAQLGILLVLLGGLKRIGQVTERLVPFMAVIYIVSALIIFFAHIGNIGNVLRGIFVGAFTPSAVVGGVAGVTISAAIKRGVGRGVFSNEAGLGSAPIAHAAADNDSAVHQGCFGVFEVFADTIVICTLTAFAVLMSGTPIEYGQAAGAPLTIAAFSTTFGRAGGVIISVGLTLFATSTILSWCLYGTRCAEFLFKSTKVIKPYQIIFCLVIILGAVTELSLVWDIADTLNGFMAIPNLVGLLGLSPIVIKLTREYFNGVRLGESNRK